MGGITQTVIGRGPELAEIDAFLADASHGARVLLIEGQPGIGKTTLWLAGLEVAAARSWRILLARPTDVEATFAYAGLGDLLEAVDEEVLSRLPVPQQWAMRVALLREEPAGPAPDARAVAVAFLNALRALSQDRWVLVAVDDVQWLDPASKLALGFAIRRLRGESIRFLLARRVEERAGPRLELDSVLADELQERIAVGPMGPEVVRRLLHLRLGLAFPHAMFSRLIATSGGNPLFALELGRAIRSRPADIEAGQDLPIPDDLTALVARRIASLPGETQDALAVTAAFAAPTIELISQAIGGPAENALGPALDAHVVSLDQERIRFTHPLLAAAVRSWTAPARRREIHAGLAAIVSDPEERARHLALAASGPDEAIASTLEAAAGRALARGAPDAAAELAAQACRLSPPDRPEDTRRRSLSEAQYAWTAGDFMRARSLTEEVIATCPPGETRGRALQLLGGIYLEGFDCRAAARLLVAAPAEAGADDGLRMRCEGWLTGALDMLGEDVREALDHGYAELELAERLGDETYIASALRGIARNEQRLTGRMPTELIERSMALEPLVAAARAVSQWPSVCYAEMLSWTDDLAAGLERWDWVGQQALERGEVNSRCDTLMRVIPYECAAGVWQRALGHAEEGYELALDGGSVVFQAIIVADRALVEAHLGDELAARRDAEEAIRIGAPLAALPAERIAAWSLGLLELSLSNPARAHEQLGPLVASRRAAGVGEPGDMRFVTDEIEALTGIGRLADAEAMLDWFEGLARRSERVGALAACGRCRGLLHAASREFEAAVAALETSRSRYAAVTEPFGLARTLLALGAVERRRLHKREAREALESAHEAFETLGARLWAQAASAELGRIGGRASSRDALTPSERRVATLVAEGRTNREVAAALVLTERTIESHLSSIYAKLGVRSRAELAHRLTAKSEPQA